MRLDFILRNAGKENDSINLFIGKLISKAVSEGVPGPVELVVLVGQFIVCGKLIHAGRIGTGSDSFKRGVGGTSSDLIHARRSYLAFLSTQNHLPKPPNGGKRAAKPHHSAHLYVSLAQTGPVGGDSPQTGSGRYSG